jgi:DNA-binding response OmpR family regulator
MNNSVLLIDDDEKMLSLLKRYLESAGFDVYTARDGIGINQLVDRRHPEIIILDVMLPGASGFDVLRELRTVHTVPVIMLTARGDLTDRVVGLELGADDYLPKPFEPRELLARMQAVMRRTAAGGMSRKKVVYGELTIDFDSRRVTLAGQDAGLTGMEFDALTIFARNPGIVLDRDTIFEQLKGLDDDSFDRSIDILISRLRVKLGDDARAPRFIRTVRGAGYVFTPGGGGAV